VETARNGTDGLALARTRQFDVIITDLMMPNLDGMEVIARLRADGNDVPIIAITAYTPFEINLNAARNDQVDIVIYKPFSSQEIRDVVESVLVKKSGGEGTRKSAGERFFPFNNQGL